VFAAVCTLLAMATHLPMAAAHVPVTAVAFGAAAVFCFARIAAVPGERGLASIGLLVGGAQIGLHLLFQATQASVARPAASMPGMAHMPAMAGATSGSALFGLTSGMTIAHVLAAAVTAWWLRRGEAALFTAVRRARAALSASWRMLAWWTAGAQPTWSTGVAMPAVGPEARGPTVARVLLFTVIRRGPPAAVCR
jgi:hypothetical protein